MQKSTCIFFCWITACSFCCTFKQVSHTSSYQSQPIVLRQISSSSIFDNLLALTLVFSSPQRFSIRIKSQLCAGQLITLEVVLHQKRRMFWVVVVLEGNAMTETQFWCRFFDVFFQNLIYPFFIILDEIPSSRHREASPQHNTPTIVSLCRWC